MRCIVGANAIENPTWAPSQPQAITTRTVLATLLSRIALITFPTQKSPTTSNNCGCLA